MQIFFQCVCGGGEGMDGVRTLINFYENEKNTLRNILSTLKKYSKK